jgi:hypothetical protein
MPKDEWGKARRRQLGKKTAEVWRQDFREIAEQGTEWFAQRVRSCETLEQLAEAEELVKDSRDTIGGRGFTQLQQLIELKRKAMERIVETKCLNCGKVVPQAEITLVQINQAFFTDLPSWPDDEDARWLRCMKCLRATESKAFVVPLKIGKEASAETIAEQPDSLDMICNRDESRAITAHTLGWFASTIRRMLGDELR